jgi:hypothetical protein
MLKEQWLYEGKNPQTLSIRTPIVKDFLPAPHDFLQGAG